MTEPVKASTWGVEVAEVAALASHADVTPATTVDPEFGTANNRRVTSEDVARWISDVEATVDLRLRKRSSLSAEAQARVLQAGKTVVLNGAASYLVDAAYPARTGVGDNSSYGSVLWNRYKTGLEELAVMVDEWAEQGGDDAPVGPLPIAASFPAPRFADDMRW